MQNQRFARLGILAGAALLLLILFSNSMFVTVKAGEKGVLFKKFGDGVDLTRVFPQGFHIIAPWNDMIIYNVREQIMEESLDVISSNGLSIKIDVSVRTKPIESKVNFIHNEIGQDYRSVIVRDLTRSTVRRVIGRYTPEELYSTKRDEVEAEISSSLESGLSEKFVMLKAAFVRSVKLPESIEQAIQSKLEQEQEALKYEFRIEKEKKEKERKMIEAEGIKEFQRIVSEGISDKLLKWKGIEATTDLAKSPNSKVIVVGSGDDGLPIILGGN